MASAFQRSMFQGGSTSDMLGDIEAKQKAQQKKKAPKKVQKKAQKKVQQKAKPVEPKKSAFSPSQSVKARKEAERLKWIEENQ